jgi:hypothetical protein
MNNTSSKGKSSKFLTRDHPITISPAEGKMCVTVAGRIAAESTGALRPEEKGYPRVYYLPRIWHLIPGGSMRSKGCPKCVQSICQAIKGSALFSHLPHAGSS